MAIPTISVANYFLSAAQKEGASINVLKLIKLVYIAHGWSLAVRRSPLLGEQAEAWKFGPIIPSVYHRYKKYGASNVTQQAAEWVGEKMIIPCVEENSAEARLLRSVWAAYKNFSSGQLSTMTHERGTPWAMVVSGCGADEKSGPLIPNYLIRGFYENQRKRLG